MPTHRFAVVRPSLALGLECVAARGTSALDNTALAGDPYALYPPLADDSQGLRVAPSLVGMIT